MLGLFKPKVKKTDEQIKEERQRYLDGAIERAARLKKLTLADNTGWEDFYRLIQEYIKQRQQRKLNTRLDQADDETIEQLKFLDYEINSLLWVLKIPEQFIVGLEAQLEKNKEEEENKEE